ncbi:Leucine-rich repeat protein kinase family protein [Prunus dulcis]|uniref:Leucine-rich repeat protein kinase family protein n=1 Tax=Prunus dulcis TaxID=3755 RepID=A0A4Y1RF95_PRUDU|nr:Leucine-rich repeat protein kinase family protein [Prunus dulcis]
MRSSHKEARGVWVNNRRFASTDPDVEGEALIDLLRALNDSSGRITDWNYNLEPGIKWIFWNAFSFDY